jgi:hypothetical protein
MDPQEPKPVDHQESKSLSVQVNSTEGWVHSDGTTTPV